LENSLKTMAAAEGKDKVFNAIISLMFLANADRAISIVIETMETLRSREDTPGVMALLGGLFGDRSDSYAGSALSSASISQLETLVKSVYDHIDPHDDAHHEGTYEPDARDHAERARNRILGALLDRPGPEAFAAMKRICLSKGNHDVIRFQELTRSKAEKDAELVAWRETEVRDFEFRGLAPVKSGEELFALVNHVFDDIITDLTSADASSRPLLKNAYTEEHVQLWLAEQLRFRAGGRYSVHREPIVADKKEPDLVLTSTSAPCQVAIEIKHGGKAWSGNDLRSALYDQLVGLYLRPHDRRHGIFVVSHHDTNRRWQIPPTGDLVGFNELISWLQLECSTLTELGASVSVCGLDTV
jgi:hypothetical protein